MGQVGIAHFTALIAKETCETGNTLKLTLEPFCDVPPPKSHPL
jgi:hypothetical protein